MIKSIFSDVFLDEYKILKNNIDIVIKEIHVKKQNLKKISNEIKELEKECVNEIKVNLDELIQNDTNLNKKVENYIKYIENTYVSKKRHIISKKNDKNSEFKLMRQFCQKELLNKQNIDNLLYKYKIHDKLKQYINEMFKKWGGHQEDVFCIVCNEYFQIPCKLNTQCECVYNICNTCVNKHQTTCNELKKNIKCIICSKEVSPTTNSSQYFFTNDILLTNISNVIKNVCNDIKKYINLDIQLVDCSICKKKFKDLKDIVQHDCSM